MNKSWLLSILVISSTLLCILRTYETNGLNLFFRGEKVLKLKNFEHAKSRVGKTNLQHLKLWESIISGRSAPLSKALKEKYKVLGLNHLFTPSGFHLSAAIFPFVKLLKSKYQTCFLIILGLSMFWLPGLTALKRMMLIKINQKFCGMHIGFIIGLILDILFGSFQNNALSFTYSFLFLGIIYSGVEGLGLIIWFFIAQLLLAYFQNLDISILVLFFSPILNLCFSLVMPILFCLSFPLYDWQLNLGILIIKNLQSAVDFFAHLCAIFPRLEVHFIFLVFIFLMVSRKIALAIVILFFLSSSLNIDRQRQPGTVANEYSPNHRILKTSYQEDQVTIYYPKGTCRLKLIRGYWWERCSPKRKLHKKTKHY